MQKFEDFEWDIYKESFPGVPLKHFVDNFARFGQVEHDKDCPVRSHDAFYNELMWPRRCNEIIGFEPKVCPPFPTTWNQWHDPITV